jgi:hypothetical protein
MSQAQKPYLASLLSGQVQVTQQIWQFSQLSAAEVCVSAGSICTLLDRLCSEDTYWIPTPVSCFPSHMSPCHLILIRLYQTTFFHSSYIISRDVFQWKFTTPVFPRHMINQNPVFINFQIYMTKRVCVTTTPAAKVTFTKTVRNIHSVHQTINSKCNSDQKEKP